MTCPHCNGTGWRATDSTRTGRVERCACWQDRRSDSLLGGARIPLRYSRCTLQSLVLYSNEKFEIAVQRARLFVEKFPAVSKGLCLIGPAGIGKTHIAVSVLRSLIVEKGVQGLFYDMSDLLRIIRSTYNPVARTAEMDILRPVMEAELLVLDDLGHEKPSEWVEETVNLIVNTRYNNKRITIFTTNFEDVPDETEMNSLRVRVGFRLHSRLHEMCEIVDYDGGDYRLLPANSGPEDLLIQWKRNKGRRTLPGRAQTQARASIERVRDLPAADRPSHELKWPGGKAGR
jgi:DNA replication protein DnaC